MKAEEEKALELYSKMWNSTPTICNDEAKQCALIAVDLAISISEIGTQESYWQEVKQHLLTLNQ